MFLNVRRLLASTTIIAVAALVYRRALSAYFFDDDFGWLMSAWSFVPSNLVAFGRMTHFYRPVIDLYFAAATPLFDGSPVLFHAASVALHATNGLVLFALTRRTSGSALYGFAAALFFVVQPAGIDAVAWVGALAETIGALFGCLSVLWFLRWRDTSRRRWRALSCAAFLLALLTHESSVVFLLVLMLADWAFVSGDESREDTHLSRATGWVRAHAPYALLTAAYLAIDLSINSRNYVVREGHYTLGWHIAQNGFGYLVALYVGRRDLLNYLFVTVAIAVLLLRGNRRVVFATAWMLLALAPFLPFNWANTSRYMYQPAIGFSMLVAEGVVQIDHFLAARVSAEPARRMGIVAVVVTAIAVRFMLYAMHNIKGFSERTEVYRRQGEAIRQVHGDLTSHSVIAPEPELKAALSHRSANALVQWVYRDPTIQFEPY